MAVVAVASSCCPPRAAQTVPPTPAAAATPPPAAPAVSADAWTASGVDWSRPPAAGAEPAFTPPVPVAFDVAGARVLLVENHRLPLVSIRVLFGRAGAREDGVHPGLAALTADLLDEGAGRFDAMTLPEEVERLGATLRVAVGADIARVSLDTLRDTLEPSLGLLADVIVRPRLTRADFERVRGDRLATLALRPDQPDEVAGLVFERQIFGAHPYAAPTTGFPATLRAIRLSEVRTFWKSRYRAGDATIIIVGDIDRATVEKPLAAAFAGWAAGTAPAPRIPPPPAPQQPVLTVVDRPGAPQSVVQIGRVGPAAGDDPAYFPLEVANTALGGSFLSRLNGRLREELGYTYGVGSSFWRGRWGGSWTIQTSLRTASTVAGIREALAIVDGTRKTELPAAELDKTLQMMTRAAPRTFETNAGIASAFEDLVTEGLPLDWHQGWIPKVRAVTAARAREAADAAWGDLSIVVVGDWTALKAGLAELGLPIAHADAEGNPVKL